MDLDAGKKNMQVHKAHRGWNQQFKYAGQHILNIKNGRAFDVHAGRDQEGRNIIIYPRHNGANQRWKIIYLDALSTGLAPGRAFNIISQLRTKRYLTLEGKNFVIKKSNDSAQQLFMYDSRTKTISTYAKKNLVLDIADGGKSRDLVANRRTGSWDQRFNIRGQHVVNTRGVVLDV